MVNRRFQSELQISHSEWTLSALRTFLLSAIREAYTFRIMWTHSSAPSKPHAVCISDCRDGNTNDRKIKEQRFSYLIFKFLAVLMHRSEMYVTFVLKFLFFIFRSFYRRSILDEDIQLRSLRAYLIRTVKNIYRIMDNYDVYRLQVPHKGPLNTL